MNVEKNTEGKLLKPKSQSIKLVNDLARVYGKIDDEGIIRGVFIDFDFIDEDEVEEMLS